MDSSDAKTTETFRVGHGRGKYPGENEVNQRLREKRVAAGKGRVSDQSESEQELDGAVNLSRRYSVNVLSYPDNTVVKIGRRVVLGEADAYKAALAAGVPVPRIHETGTTPDGKNFIRMDRVPGESLDKLWNDMAPELKQDIAGQLRAIVDKMRAAVPPPDFIGACDGTEMRDARDLFTYHCPTCKTEQEFNDFLLESLHRVSPPLIRQAFKHRLRTNHRIVLSHCDLGPRNIMVQDGRITGIVDWEDSGWYPEYWEYFKFFRGHAYNGDWDNHAETIFSELYHDELVDFLALTRWQNP